jgi:hypothetical protein
MPQMRCTGGEKLNGRRQILSGDFSTGVYRWCVLHRTAYLVVWRRIGTLNKD